MQKKEPPHDNKIGNVEVKMTLKTGNIYFLLGSLFCFNKIRSNFIFKNKHLVWFSYLQIKNRLY